VTFQDIIVSQHTKALHFWFELSVQPFMIVTSF
jgi:hypothetical protein